MDHAAERRHPGSGRVDVGEHLLDGTLRGKIDDLHMDRRPALPQFGDGGLRLLLRNSPSSQDHRTRSRVGQPAGHRHAEPAERSGHQVASILAHLIRSARSLFSAGPRIRPHGAPDQLRRPPSPVAQRQFRLAAGGEKLDRERLGRHGLSRVQVQQPDPHRGEFQRRRPRESPKRRARGLSASNENATAVRTTEFGVTAANAAALPDDLCTPGHEPKPCARCHARIHNSLRQRQRARTRSFQILAKLRCVRTGPVAIQPPQMHHASQRNLGVQAGERRPPGLPPERIHPEPGDSLSVRLATARNQHLLSASCERGGQLHCGGPGATIARRGKHPSPRVQGALARRRRLDHRFVPPRHLVEHVVQRRPPLRDRRRALRHLQPVALPLKRIRRKRNPATAFPSEQTLEGEVQARLIGARDRPDEVADPLPPLARDHTRPFGIRPGERRHRAQHGVRADLHEHIHAQLGQGRHRGRELHRFACLTSPMVSVRCAGERPTGQIAHQWDVRRRRAVRDPC